MTKENSSDLNTANDLSKSTSGIDGYFPKVSVVIPCYNDGEFLHEAVSSVLSQTYPSIEIIIVNDASTDPKTLEILESISHHKITIYHNTENMHLSGTRNRGISQAQGKYILPLDADDKIDATYVQKAVDIIENDVSIGAVYCKAELFGLQCGPLKIPDYSPDNMLLGNIVFATALFRKSDWEKIGGYSEDFRSGYEDYDFWLSMLELGKEFFQIPEVLFYYRKKDSSMLGEIGSDITVLKKTYRQIYSNHTAFFEKHKDEYARKLLDAWLDNFFISKDYAKALGEASETISRLTHENEQLKRSTSWRITKPLRLIFSLVKKIFRPIPGIKPLYVLLSDVLKNGINGAIRVRAERNIRVLEMDVAKRIEPKNTPFTNMPIISNKSDSTKTTPIKLDIVLVTYNSEKWIANCFKSIFESDFDKKNISIYIVDNNSSDNTLLELETCKGLYSNDCAEFKIIQSKKNLGFGKGNNIAVKHGNSDYLFLLNIDTELYTNTLNEIQSEILSSGNDVVAWELRQFPHEHPKVYDVVTGFTTWCSAAALVIKRNAFEEVRGFDKNIFMYAEDVDLSWRLRALGYKLKYIPKAAVKHFTYEAGIDIVKPTQYVYSLINHYNLRIKFGTSKCIKPFKKYLKALTVLSQEFEGASEMLRAAYRKNKLKTLHFYLWKFLNRSAYKKAVYKFIGADYEDRRDFN